MSVAVLLLIALARMVGHHPIADAMLPGKGTRDKQVVWALRDWNTLGPASSSTSQAFRKKAISGGRW